MKNYSVFSVTKVTALCSVALLSLSSLAHPAADAFDVTEKTILELQSAQVQGRATSRSLVEVYLARIAAYDQAGPQLNSIFMLNKSALTQADALDRERKVKGPRGPLHGIPVLIKDNFDTADMPTSGGTLALATLQPEKDAFQVRRLREAGAVILGKTAMHELAAGITTVSSLTGFTRNPYDPARSPGGSSGGTGASVAASFAAAGMGSDTCGSLRIPAANQNMVALRTTSGLSSRAGVMPLSSTMDVAGPMARTMSDLAIMLDATVGMDPDDATTLEAAKYIPPSYQSSMAASDLRGKRIGVLSLLFGAAPEDAEVATVVRKSLDTMKGQGAELVEVAIPDLFALAVGGNVIGHEFKFDLADYLAQHPNAPVKSLAEILSLGLHHEQLDALLRLRDKPTQRDTEAYKVALEKRKLLRDAVLNLMATQKLDAIAYPVLQRKAALIGDAQPGATCPLSSNTGLPALSVPAGFTPDGVPVGMELLGAAFAEANLMSLGFALERLNHLRRAPYSTPQLVGGQAPPPVRFVTTVPADGQGTAAQVAFVYDVSTSRLDFVSSVTDGSGGGSGGEVIALTLHRALDGKPGPVIAHLLKVGQKANSAAILLKSSDREALSRGNLYLQLNTRATPLGGVRQALLLVPR